MPVLRWVLVAAQLGAALLVLRQAVTERRNAAAETESALASHGPGGWFDAVEQRAWLDRALASGAVSGPGHLDAGTEPALDSLLPDSDDAYQRALALNPYASPVWIAWGLSLEAAGEAGRAEGALLQAARVDRTLAPAWTLANFYFRRGRHAEFWDWARLAAARTYDGYHPLLRLANEFEPDALELLDRLGGGRELTRAYLDWLIAEDRLGDAQSVALRLVSSELEVGSLPGTTQSVPNSAGMPAQDAARLAGLAGRQIEAGRRDAALDLWNRTGPPLDPLVGPVVANPDLVPSAEAGGFAWKLHVCPGVRSFWSEAGLQFSFSGSQADECMLLEQVVPTSPGVRYGLSVEAGARLVQASSAAEALRWSFGGQISDGWLGGEDSDPGLAPGAPLNGDRTAGFYRFEPAEGELTRLGLFYRRRAGAAALHGTVVLHHIEMQVVD